MSSVWNIVPPVILAALALAMPNANAGSDGAPVDFTVDGDQIYWAGVASGRAGRCLGSRVVNILNRTALGAITTDTLAKGSACRGGSGIVVDGSDVYWVTSNVTPDEWSIEKVPVDGGPPTTVLTTTTPIRALARDQTHLYWSQGSSDPTLVDGTINKIPLAGGTPVQVATGFTSPGLELFVRNGMVYFSDFNPNFGGIYRVLKVPVSGGDPTVIANATGRGVRGFDVDSSHIYWFDVNVVRRTPLAGGGNVTLASGLTSPSGIAVDGTYVYFLDGVDGEVRKVSVSGGPVSVLARGQGHPTALAYDSRRLYWIDDGKDRSPSILTVPAAGGVVTTVAPIVRSAEEFFPLQSGNRWTYLKNGTTTVTQTVLGGTVPVNGVATKALQTSDGLVNYLTSDANGVRWHRQFDPAVDIGDGTPRNSTLTFTPPIVIAEGNSSTGSEFVGDGTATFDIEGFQPTNFAYTVTSRIGDFENVSVPLDSFLALKVELTLTLAGTTQIDTYWLTKYMGPVRQTETSSEGTDTFELTALSLDTDRDGVENDTDTDDDNDGIPDWFEQATAGLNPLDATDAALDIDADGLSNLMEFQLGTDLTNPDTDGDGVIDGDEISVGRNPSVNEAAVLQVIDSILLTNE